MILLLMMVEAYHQPFFNKLSSNLKLFEKYFHQTDVSNANDDLQNDCLELGFLNVSLVEIFIIFGKDGKLRL